MAFNLKTIFASSEKKEMEATITKLVAAIKQQRTLYRKEIQEWKTARAAALQPEKPRRKQLIDLYDDILGDAFIYGISENRKLRVSNKAFSIVNGKGEVDDEKTKLLQKSWFNQYVKYSVESIYFGYNLLYPKELDKNGYIKKLALVYRDHVVPETCELLKNSFDDTGIKFNEAPYNKWVLWKNHDDFLGILDKAAPLWIFKKHSWQNWDEFEEMFGIPMRTAKTASQDPRVQKEIDGWLQDFGSSNWARLPEGVEFEIKESNSRDSFNVFNEKRKACNEELAILFDGNAEGSKDSGSRAKSETIIESTQALIAMDDETRVLFDVQDDLLPFLIARGYPFAEDDRFIWNENKKSTPEERLKIFQGVHKMGYKVKKEQVKTELDVELEDEEEIVDPREPEPKDKVKNKASNKKPEARANFKQPHAHSSSCECGANDCYRVIDFTLMNALSDDEEEFLKQYFENPDSINWSYKEFKASHGKLLQGLREGFNGVDTDFESEDHLMMQMFQSNIHRFGVDKTLKEIMDMNQILKTSKDFSEFRTRVKVMFPNYREKWLRSEYTQAQTTSRMGARYIEMMRDIDIAPFWRLVAVLDKGTTKICSSLHKKVFSKLDPKTWVFLPSNHWGCRSDAEDVLEGYSGKVTSFDEAVGLDPDGYERMVKSGFNVNWGDAKEVFSATQSYLHKAEVEPLDVMTLDYKDYNLEPFSKIKTSEELPIADLLYNMFSDGSGAAKFMDVFELPIWMDGQLFNSSSTRIRKSIKDVLANPSEVFWKKENDINYKTFLKFYKKDTVQIVTTFTENERAKIVSIKGIKKVDETRKGLLLYTPKEHLDYRLSQYESFGKDYKKITFDAKNGGFIVQHKLHGKNEIQNNIFTGNKLVEIGKSVELLPVGIDKTADALVNGVEWEFKLLTNYTNLFNTIKREVKRGSKQSPNVLLHIVSEFDKKEVIRGLIAAVKNDDGRLVKFISIISPEGKFYMFSRKQIESAEFIKILNQ